MRRWLFVVLLLLIPSQAVAGDSLEARIQSATGIVRPVDAALQARAAVRVIQIETDFSHCCLIGNEAEIIAWNSGQPDPIGYLVTQWLNSPEHRAILVNPYWQTIGCAVAVSGLRTYGVCLFGADSTPDTSVPNPPATIPNTAMRRP